MKSEKPRCHNCTRKYNKGTKEYNTILNQVYIRKGAGGAEWICIPFGYCPDCKKIYPLK